MNSLFLVTLNLTPSATESFDDYMGMSFDRDCQHKELVAKKLILYNFDNPWLNMGNVHMMGTSPFQAPAAEFVSDERVGDVHAARSRLLLDFFIFALNLDLTINVSTVFAKLPIAIAISRIPHTTTCDSMHRL